MKNITKNLMLIITIILAISYAIFNVIYSKSNINEIDMIVNSILISLIAITFALYYFKKKVVTIPATLLNMLIVSFLFINLLTITNLFSFPNQKVLGNLCNKDLAYALEIAKQNNIKVTTIYENSENIEENKIILQDVSSDKLLKDVKNLNLIVSEGKDPNKIIQVPNMLGWDTKRVTKYVLENALSNIDIEFTKSEEKTNTIISQSKKGELKRSENILLTFAQDPNFEFASIEMIDLKSKTLFEANLWAKQNGIEITKDFSFNDDLKDKISLKDSSGKVMDITKVKKGIIINQKEEAGTLITSPNITLTISKGNKIIVPDLMNMSIEDITLFATSNNLKVNFNDRYDSTVSLGKVIETNYKKGDVIEFGTVLEILSSKGQLKMEKFSTLDEFRAWASKYSIPTAEIFEANTEIAEGNIIRFSKNENDVLANGETVTVYISKGAPVKVPSVSGTSKTTAISLLSKAGLSYTVTYASGFNSASLNTVISQSIAAGTTVDKGTKINIVLSKGPGVTVPSLVGKSRDAAASALSTVGLTANFVTGSYSNAAANTAVSQSISAGAKVEKGTRVTVTLSKGKANSQTVYIQPNWIVPGNASATAGNISSKLKEVYSDINVNVQYVKTNEPNKTGLVAMSETVTITQGQSVTIKVYQ